MKSTAGPVTCLYAGISLSVLQFFFLRTDWSIQTIRYESYCLIQCNDLEQSQGYLYYFVVFRHAYVAYKQIHTKLLTKDVLSQSNLKRTMSDVDCTTIKVKQIRRNKIR